MRIRYVLVLMAMLAGSSALSAAPPVSNGPDVVLTLAAPANTHVYEARRYTYTIKNDGNRTAFSVGLVINLPRTGTSPQVYVMGVLSGFSNRCTLSGTTLTCQLGDMAKNTRTTIFADLQLPYSTQPIVLDATASTSGDTRPTNNRVVHTANLLTYPVTMAFVDPVVHQHCTGNTSLSSFFECTLFPSSIREHETIYNADHSITFVDAPASYTGSWTYTAASNRLQFDYFDGYLNVAHFDGRGVGGNCFEGLTTFPSSPSGYVSLYRFCF